MLKLPRTGLISLLAILLHSAVDVEATCGHCYGAHACVDNTTFQLCIDGVPRPELSIPCPAELPVCTRFAAICLSLDSGFKSDCGDTSNCGQCGDNAIFACTTQTSFGKCVDGELPNPERISCPSGSFCSVKGAAAGDPCVYACEPDSSDTCDREKESDSDNDTTATIPTPTNTPPPQDASSFCQTQQKAGRFAIPNDTVCISFIHCSYKAGVWQGSITDCPRNKPYFHAASTCGTVKPTGVGCV
ncbi:uncharacterized protein LOC117787577 [Drosophila innubila]|uniref:uncharacterized protein LOC117787577 n=1 Tax=Drosophila innubila TaxID=198719 RepID=UPI00148B88AE|nr:uncharacterized protein LOC117787577 [Drosophila innubila]